MSSFERAAFVALLAAASTTQGCAEVHSAKIAGPGPASGAAVVLSGTPKRGRAAVTLPSGEQCAGEFNTIADHLTWDDERVYWVDSEDSRLGMFVVSCPSGYVLRCDFAEDATGPGRGSCRDRAGTRYALVM